MARRRKLSFESYNFQTNIDARHLAFAATLFSSEGKIYAVRNASVLIRSIVEDWINLQGGSTIETLDEAKSILSMLGIMLDRKETTEHRGHFELNDREQAENTAFAAELGIPNKDAELREERLRRLENRKRIERVTKFWEKATDEDLAIKKTEETLEEIKARITATAEKNMSAQIILDLEAAAKKRARFGLKPRN